MCPRESGKSFICIAHLPDERCNFCRALAALAGPAVFGGHLDAAGDVDGPRPRGTDRGPDILRRESSRENQGPLQRVRQLVPIESLAGATWQPAGLERIEKQSLRIAIT